MQKYQLHYTKAAGEWVEALPLGNGHMGAMAYGNGLYDLTESTCWSGCREKAPLGPDAADYMEQARAALLARRPDEAERLLSHCTGIKKNYGTQLPMGRLQFCYQGGTTVFRSLDLMEGIARETLTVSDTAVRGEAWISNLDKVMAVRMCADAPVPSVILSLRGWSHPMKTDIRAEERQLCVDGMALENIHSDGLHGVNYCIRLKLETDGMVTRARDGFRIEGAKEITAYLSAACDLYGLDARALCEKRLNEALSKDYDTLFARHSADVREHMERCVLTLPENENSHLPTDVRISAYREDKTDHAFAALYFMYGRYLLFISSREDSILPAALQGILNDDRACRMEWTDDMHLDINTQMNYYPAEPTGLGDTTYPLFRWIRDALMPQGECMARDLYHADGWCAHTVSNAHGWAAPGWDVDWGLFPSGGAWAAVHIWEHWLYTGDRDFLQDYFPVLRGCARFYRDILSFDEKTGTLVVNPSFSPENRYRFGDRHYCMTVGATADTALARYLMEAVCEGAEVLGLTDEEYEDYRTILAKLPGWQTDDLGRLQEWIDPYKDAFPDHRHMCHLIALHPLGLIDAKKEPQLASAIRRVMECRLGDNARDIILANWAGAMLIIMHARLFDGEAAGLFIEPMIAFLSRANMLITHEGPTDSVTGGVYELDGNTGLTAAITEMLLQNHRDRVDILPAIPDTWTHGSVSGLCLYGGHRCDIRWNETDITVTVRAASDFCRIISYHEQSFMIHAKEGTEETIRFHK